MAAPIFRWWLSWRILVGLSLLLLVAWRWNEVNRDSRWSLATAQPLPAGNYAVVKVIDGDTLRVKLPATTEVALTGEITIRLLGINAPEDTTRRDPFGPEATEFLRENAEGREVFVEWDKRRIDKYGRRLAYLYAGDLFLNHELVKRGLARVFAYPGDNSTIARNLSKAEEGAKREGVGLWSVEQDFPESGPTTKQ